MMNIRKIAATGAVVAIAFGLAACSKKPAENAATENMAGAIVPTSAIVPKEAIVPKDAIVPTSAIVPSGSTNSAAFTPEGGPPKK